MSGGLSWQVVSKQPIIFCHGVQLAFSTSSKFWMSYACGKWHLFCRTSFQAQEVRCNTFACTISRERLAGNFPRRSSLLKAMGAMASSSIFATTQVGGRLFGFCLEPSVGQRHERIQLACTATLQRSSHFEQPGSYDVFLRVGHANKAVCALAVTCVSSPANSEADHANSVTKFKGLCHRWRF